MLTIFRRSRCGHSILLNLSLGESKQSKFRSLRNNVLRHFTKNYRQRLCYRQSRHRSRVIKRAGIVIDMVSIQYLLAPFCCVLGKDTFPLLGSWQAALYFSHISIKLKKQNKKFQFQAANFGTAFSSLVYPLSYRLTQLKLFKKAFKFI